MGVYDLIVKTISDIETGADWRVLWADEIELQKAAYDMILGAKTAKGASVPDKPAFAAKVEELRACCEAKIAAAGVGADETGKIGDGTILKLIMQILPLILQLIG